MPGPLEGLLVVALEQAVAAPYCTARLADAGARVIKIERAVGDFARDYDRDVRGQSAYFVWLNRGKESITLDFTRPDDAALLRCMLARADIFVQNLGPGAAERAGFGSEALRARHPRLITCDITGYGEDGPYRERKAYDMLVQAESGLASITGSPDGPGRVGVSVCDVGAGMYALIGIQQALLQRARTGRGEGVKVSLFGAMADWMSVPLLQYTGSGREMRRSGLHHYSIAPYGAYACRDGAVVISIQNEREWRAFCAKVLAVPDLADDARFADNPRRVANREALDRIIAGCFAAFGRAELAGRFDAARIAYGAINSVADLLQHPQLRLMRVETPNGPVEMPYPGAAFAGETPHAGPVPALGEHSAAIRAEFAG
jgi:crotonobetainyl-CoA:carnitine CoA-transferase CaiB-like acyl-CoA transferase